jgi:hypothetical protein
MRTKTLVATLLLGLPMLPGLVTADDGRRAAPRVPPTAAQRADAATYREECAACHVAYPASLLRPAEWSAVLGGLDRHFGVDATLTAEARVAVARHLGVDPATGVDWGASARQAPRITTQPWFVREHRERGARSALAPRAKWSQCDGCHAAAADGRFEEE